MNLIEEIEASLRMKNANPATRMIKQVTISVKDLKRLLAVCTVAIDVAKRNEPDEQLGKYSLKHAVKCLEQR